jgi:phage regulator Rha-like protein
MIEELEIVIANDSIPRIDSRLVAKSLGIEHESLVRTLTAYGKEFEELGLLRFQIGVKSGPQRGKLPQYAMLTEDQAIFAATLSRNTPQVVDFKLKLTKAFSEARQQLQQVGQGELHSSNHTLTDTFRPRALENLRRVPDGYFSIMGELFKHLYNLEALFNRSLDGHAMIEISVGLRWARYAREVLHIPDQHRCKYAHVCQGGRIEQVWAYAIRYVTTFDKWLWEVYFPQHFPSYERYRARYIGLPAPKIREQLPSAMKRSRTVQPPFEWE